MMSSLFRNQLIGGAPTIPKPETPAASTSSVTFTMCVLAGVSGRVILFGGFRAERFDLLPDFLVGRTLNPLSWADYIL